MGKTLAARFTRKYISGYTSQRPLKRDRDKACRLAEAIERGRALHPEWDQTTDMLFGDQNGAGIEHLSDGTTLRPITQACAMGFAIAGGFKTGGTDPNEYTITVEADNGMYTKQAVSSLNDTYHWDLDTLIERLRAAAGEECRAPEPTA